LGGIGQSEKACPTIPFILSGIKKASFLFHVKIKAYCPFA